MTLFHPLSALSLPSQVTWPAIGLVWIFVLAFAAFMKLAPGQETTTGHARLVGRSPFAAMLHKVVVWAQHLKILNSVVALVPVLMVNMLVTVKRTTKMLLHEHPMFESYLAVNAVRFVTVLGEESRAILSSLKTCVTMQSDPVVMKATKSTSPVWPQAPIDAANSTDLLSLQNAIPSHPVVVLSAPLLVLQWLAAIWNGTCAYEGIMPAHFIKSTSYSPS